MNTFGRKKTLRLTFVVSFALTLGVTLLCGQTNSQSRDPLQRKLDFLKTKLESYLTHSEREGEGPELGNSRFEATSFESCKITWRSSVNLGPNSSLPASLNNVRIINQVSVDLAAIDPGRTRIYVVEHMARRKLPRSLAMELRIRAGGLGFKHRMETTSGGRVTRTAFEDKSYAFFFDRNDQAVAEEVSNAFAEAANICRLRVRRRQ